MVSEFANFHNFFQTPIQRTSSDRDAPNLTPADAGLEGMRFQTFSYDFSKPEYHAAGPADADSCSPI